VGVPDKNPVVVWDFGPTRYLGFFILFAVIGGLAGLGIGILLAGVINPRNPKQSVFQKETNPQSIEDYYKKQK